VPVALEVLEVDEVLPVEPPVPPVPVPVPVVVVPDDVFVVPLLLLQAAMATRIREETNTAIMRFMGKLLSGGGRADPARAPGKPVPVEGPPPGDDP
jgi:hypothetical protein